MAGCRIGTEPVTASFDISLTELVGRRTAAGVRQRGGVYFRSHAVDIVQADQAEVRARVRGSRQYLVRLALEGETLFVSCDCAYFASQSEVCKHIWATLLSAEVNGYLSDGEGLVQAFSESGPKLEVVGDSDEDESARPGLPGEYGSVYGEPDLGGRSPLPRWQKQLEEIASYDDATDRLSAKGLPLGSELFYLVDASETRSSGHLTVDVVRRERKRDGSWGKPKSQTISADLIAGLSQAADRQILSMVLGALDQGRSSVGNFHTYGAGPQISGTGIRVAKSVQDVVIQLICRSGRGRLRAHSLQSDPPPLAWDDGDPWELWLEAATDESRHSLIVNGRLQRGAERIPLDRPAIVLASGFVFNDDGTVSRLRDFGAFGWISSIRNSGPLTVPAENSRAFLHRILSLPDLPKVDFPPALSWKEVTPSPRPRLQIRPGHQAEWGRHGNLTARLSFDYDGVCLAYGEPRRGVYSADTGIFVLRDPDAEGVAAHALLEHGFKLDDSGEFKLKPRRLPAAVRTLSSAGWHVEAEGKLYRSPGDWRIQVSSGTDWFDLNAFVEFGGTAAALPELLAAARRGDKFVPLDDGTMGILPEDWLSKFGALATLGTRNGSKMRFMRSQTGLLDALLAAQPEVSMDEAFSRARRELSGFEGILPAEAPAGFCGELRPYQKDGLGWLEFLQKFGFGGCLADDMGLGKTVQVLALLESRREMRRSAGESVPSLVVVPKSLVFNWLHEAERFTPKLRLLDHTGSRVRPGFHFDEYDVVLTTYGTLRSDAAELGAIHFDFCILDEAQAIKNPGTAAAKAARLIQANHRLALSGTPIENHLGELWSLFEFLNPGMLGAAGAFKLGAGSNAPDEANRTLLAKALRPFILRRTKDQVAGDLPRKNEQTLLCELEGAQRRHYDELRDHFRQDLLRRVESDGMAKSKMLVLEALLRLRQAACHPGLLNPAMAGEPSAKLEVLLPQLAEVADEGHKALVFSQFTKLLGIVCSRLDREGISYGYLDGRTRDRQQQVERFQNDPDCKLFLISLKAGGLGLNLTAADYVFLLDPWWNPAVEAQAIDRTHRIGQTRPVFAIRIIAAGTVEEKVLELQESKRALADSIINADNSLIRKMNRDDLELLLS